MLETTNLKLKKYEDSDVADPSLAINPNMDIIDAEIKKLNDNKSNSGHTHTKSNITDFSHSHTKSEISDFTHTHTKANITDFPSISSSVASTSTSVLANSNAVKIAYDKGVEALGVANTKASSGHTHTKANITDFSHTHTRAEISDFSHNHTKANITDFAHTHAMGDITGLELSSSKVTRPGGKTVETSLVSNETSIASLSKNDGNLSQLQTTNKTNLVSAINEVFQSANNGKTTIATSVGSPLLASDTFSAMGTKIDTLTQTFKNNLTAKGVTVGTTDKMSNLIDKIEGLSSIKIKSGASLPSVVEEGVLFIQTTTPINKINIQDAQPSLSEGDVYIKSSSDSSQGALQLYTIGDISKSVKVYVSSVQQIDNGILTTKSAWIGQSGQWVQFSFEEYIIFSSNICNLGSDVPSNWGYYKVLSGSGTPTISILTDPKRLKFYVSSGSYSDAKFYCYIKQTIDLTSFKKIYFDISKISMSSYVYSGVGILHSTEDKIITSKTYSWSQYPANELVELDVSTLNGPHRIFATVSTGSSNVFCSLEIPKIYLTS